MQTFYFEELLHSLTSWKWVAQLSHTAKRSLHPDLGLISWFRAHGSRISESESVPWFFSYSFNTSYLHHQELGLSTPGYGENLSLGKFFNFFLACLLRVGVGMTSLLFRIITASCSWFCIRAVCGSGDRWYQWKTAIHHQAIFLVLLNRRTWEALHFRASNTSLNACCYHMTLFWCHQKSFGL